MIDHLGLSRMAVLLVLALLVFGPERLPELAAQAGRLLRQARTHLGGLSSELRQSMGPEVGDLDLAALHPRKVLSQLMAEDPEPTEVDPFSQLALHSHLAPEPSVPASVAKSAPVLQ